MGHLKKKSDHTDGGWTRYVDDYTVVNPADEPYIQLFVAVAKLCIADIMSKPVNNIYLQQRKNKNRNEAITYLCKMGYEDLADIAVKEYINKYGPEKTY